MINSQFRFYDYYIYEEIENEYGQTSLQTTKSGKVKMAINLQSQSIVNNILYQDASYQGLTYENIDDNYVIDFEGIKLKVLYVNDFGRMKQVYLARM